MQHDEKMYQILKRDHQFSIDEEIQCFKPLERESLAIAQLPKKTDKNRATSKTMASRRKRITRGLVALDINGRFNAKEEGAVLQELQRSSSSAFDLPLHFREIVLTRKSCIRRRSTHGEITKSPVSVIDEIFDVMEDDESAICEDEDTNDEEYSEEEIIEWVVPLKEDNFDSQKRYHFTHGEKRKEELLLDNAWGFYIPLKRATGKDFLSGDEESVDHGDSNVCPPCDCGKSTL